MMKARTLAAVAALALGACTTGYWPPVTEGTNTPRYQSDVRECQTETQSAASQWAFVAGGALSHSIQASEDSQSPEGKKAMNHCMEQRGYHVRLSGVPQDCGWATKPCTAADWARAE
jgi:hypothetical protein